MVQDPPTNWRGILRQLGPGLIITASIVGSGELIMTTQTGARNGFFLLWFIILGCIVKVFVQIELGRYAVCSGETTLSALNRVPGPRFGPNWLVYLWLGMFVSTFFQLGGILGSLSQVFAAGGLRLSDGRIAVFISLSCALLLALGHYRWVERLSTGMVACFTLLTVLALVMLAHTPYAIRGPDIVEGLSFRLSADFAQAFATFGIIGVGASELIYYPYWCLEKGYAARVGPYEPGDAWLRRARGWMRVMQIDALVSLVVYTTSTVAFYLLGASILHRQGLEVSNDQLVATLSSIYRTSYGTWGMSVFLVGAFAVLYSTVFISTASNGRLCVDLARLVGQSTGQTWVQALATESGRRRWVWWACVLLPSVYLTIWLVLRKPLSLVTLGGIAQGIMLPFLGFASIYLLYSRVPRALHPGPIWKTLLWFSALSMAAVGLTSARHELGRLIPPQAAMDQASAAQSMGEQ
jgi:Mn2+/Fe2+ NRAMP family transporter